MTPLDPLIDRKRMAFAYAIGAAEGLRGRHPAGVGISPAAWAHFCQALDDAAAAASAVKAAMDEREREAA